MQDFSTLSTYLCVVSFLEDKDVSSANFTIYPIDSSVIYIFIDAPVDFNETYGNIDIRLKRGNAECKTKWLHVGTTSPTTQIYRVSGLKPDSVYTLDFVGQREGGSNDKLSTVTILTPPTGMRLQVSLYQIFV